MKGLFITFEGIDGSGKTTQAERLADHLSSLGRWVMLTREPGGTRVSERIRSILLDSSNHHMCWLTEMLLYMASRAQHTDEIIRPALTDGAIVISDRYLDATVAYQGYGRGLDLKIIRTLNAIATSGLKPDVTFLVDLAPEICEERMARIKKKADRMERSGNQFQLKVREGYLAIARNEPDRFSVLDGTEPIEQIEQKVRRIIEPLLVL